MNLLDPFLLQLLEPYLGVKEKWKLRHLCKTTREWVHSPAREKTSMIRCLKQCYGLWEAASIGRKDRRSGPPRPEEASAWIEIELALLREQEEEESHDVQEFEIPGAKFRKVCFPHLSATKHVLRYLSFDWVRGEEQQGDWDKILNQIDLYELVDGSVRAFKHWEPEEMSKLAVCLGGPIYKHWHWPLGHPATLMRWVLSDQDEKFPAAREWNPCDDWVPRMDQAGEAPCDACQFLPHEAAVPFYVRLALTDSDLVKRLIDFEDKEMTPGTFMQLYDMDDLGIGYHDLNSRRGDMTDNDGGDCTEVDSELFEDLPETAAELIRTLLQNTRIFEIPPEEFWDIDRPIGRSKETKRIKDELFAMESEYEFWERCCESLAVHFRHHVRVVLDTVGAHPTAQPLNTEEVKLEDFAPTEGLMSPYGQGQFATLQISLGEGFDEINTYHYPRNSIHLFVAQNGALLYRAQNTDMCLVHNR